MGVSGCGQSAPPAAAVASVEVTEAKDVAVAKDPAAPEPKTEAPIPDGGSFPFPEDLGGKALAKNLAPVVPPPMRAEVPIVPKERKLPAFLDAPAPALPDPTSAPPRLPLSPVKEVRPSALPDRVPADLGGSLPQLPTRAELPTGPLTRQQGLDVTKPADLPMLSSRPVPDRAPLTDPTIEFTAQSVISPTLPLRTEPTPFIRINLPDPFEHADAAKVRTPVVVDPNRSLPR
jgi:hypothetical protein